MIKLNSRETFQTIRERKQMKAIKIFYISVAIFVISLFISGCGGAEVSRKLKCDLLSDSNTIVRINKILNEKGIFIRSIYTTDHCSCYLVLDYDVLRAKQVYENLDGKYK